MGIERFYLLIIIKLLLSSYVSSVSAVTDRELKELEEQLEQQELEERKQIKERQVEEKRKKTEAMQKEKRELEEKRLADEKKRLEEEKRLYEATRLKEQEQQQHERERKEKYKLVMSEAKRAYNGKDKSLAIKKYNEVLSLFPDDVFATQGIKNAKKLKHKLCYEVLGKWNWEKAFGKEFIILHDNGTIDYQAGAKGSGSWECSSPETRTIKIRISMAGFSNEWLSTYSEDGQCLLGPESWGERGCYRRLGSEAE
jgi:actin-related protein